MNLLSVRREVGEFRKRYKWMALFVICAFTFLLGRAFQLQVVEHDHYGAIARENITKTLTLPATRGVIRDRTGRIVVTNRPAYDVYVTPRLLREGDVERIVELMGLTGEERAEFERRLGNVPEHRLAHQIRFFTDVRRDQLASLETHELDLPAIDVVVSPLRTYPYEHLGAHAIGYLNELTAEELDELRPAGYRLGDRIGRSGVERAWESFLRGRRGYRRVPVDARGRIMEGVAIEDGRPTRVDPVPGRDMTLTLDMDLMRIAERAFRGHPSGAVVVVDVNTGAVRALFSKPSYDLNELTSGMSRDRYAEMRDPRSFRPLIDRTIYESYFPGSTFKPITALAALQDQLVDPAARVECFGAYTLGRTRFRCTAQHGEMDMREAMVHSCNVYFYVLAQQVGLDRLARVAQDFGLGRRSGVGINTEASGFIPTREWYERGDQHWRAGYALNTAIGQGDTRVTLLQLAMSYAAIANGGTLYVPQLVETVSSPDGSIVEEFQPRVRRRVHVDRDHLEYVVDSLYGAVNDQGGTAYDARIDGGIIVAGKTGTAQVSERARHDIDPDRAWYLNRPHAWFAGFAPADHPEVAIVVLVEHGGAGGRQAAPIAIRILQEYLGGREQTVTASVGVPAVGAR
ncbi:penicillin-binding protein 2 [Sandaracinus amylolyticus]|uniref:Cell division protein FtsI n=1 Tax=Sandaracinus amylolyticus TaxID=927083 RepID=A0A0F6YGF0_9BACT|nr:penicillin-binding protein 2 [Sandaracinus amylolyticus]AKF04601.1 Cell division protein FtsI [Sandaracinus amylolyticus]